MKRCSRCGQDRPESAFAGNSSRPDGLTTYCRECKSVYNREYYARTKRTHRSSRRTTREQARARNRTWLLEHLSGRSCADCPESDPIVLEFDHPPGSDKAAHVSRLMSGSLARLQAEVAKCDVVCANCHRRRTYSRQGAYRVRP